MMNKLVISRSRRDELLILVFILVMIILVVFLFFSRIYRLDTLLLIIFGFSFMGIALFFVVTSSSQPIASFGVWFVFILSLQHGGGWILEQIFTDQHYSRILFFTDHTLAKSVFLSGIGLLSFACNYVFYNSQRHNNNLRTDCVAKKRISVINEIPWSILLIWGIGYLFFEISGGMNLFGGASRTVYIIRSIFGFLSKIVIILISVKLFTLRLKIPFIYLILVVLLGGFVLLTGQRQYIIGMSLTTIVLSNKWRLTTTKAKQIILLGLFFLVIMVSMAYLRDKYGRDTFTDMTLNEQFAVISEGETNDVGDFLSSIKYDLGYRLNAGNILLGLMADLPEVNLLWLEPVTFSIKSLIPNIIWNGKAQVFTINMPRLISNHYGISNKGDYIVTFISVFYSMGGVPMVLLLNSLLGIAIAFLDIRLAQFQSIFSITLAIGLGYGLLSIDHSIDLLFLSIRDSLLLYLLIKLAIINKEATRKKVNDNYYRKIARKSINPDYSREWK